MSDPVANPTYGYEGVPYMERMFTTAGIDAKVKTTTLVFENSRPTVFVPTAVALRCVSATDITVGPSIGFGTTASLTDVFTGTAILALTAPPKMFGYVMLGMSVYVPSGGKIYLNVTKAATGTALTFDFDMRGYYRD